MSCFKRIGVLLATLGLVFSFGCTAEIEAPPGDAVWIDVRTAEEYAEGHLAQAALIPYDVIEKGVTDLHLAKDAPIYLYCRSGNRAGKAKMALEAQHYTHVVNVGGLEDARSLAGLAK
ncbi:MAG: rhodanese-like domain-containing protein [Proteobacteria bacterium]|nr:rhodanese-like domain-containing protein [Pseudomonadota bacterium]